MIISRLHKLLTGEYEDFEDVVLCDAPFVEVTASKKGLQQVYLGITTENFILAVRQLLNYKDFPEVFRNTEVDLDIDGLEIKWLAPLCFLSFTTERYSLKIECTGTGKKKIPRYFELNSVEDRAEEWERWLDRIQYLKADPYGVYKEMRRQFELERKKYEQNKSKKKH